MVQNNKNGKKIKKKKKEMRVEYVFVETPDIEERMEKVFNIIFSKMLAKERLERQKNQEEKL